jgi:hypothetical protein
MHTFTFTGKSASLAANYFPPIQLQHGTSYEIGFLSFESFNAIPNIDKDNNKLCIEGMPTIDIPVGCYEFNGIVNFLETHINENQDIYKDVFINLQSNNNTLKARIKCSHPLDFTKKDSIHKLLGFKPQIVPPHKKFLESSHPLNIFHINVIRINCSIVTGSFHNNKPVHTIHEFFPNVPPGYKIIESPQNVIYLPVDINYIDHINIEIVDQDGKLINFNEEVVTVRLHLRARYGY